MFVGLMFSAPMAVQNETGTTRSNMTIPVNSGISFNAALHSANGLQIKEPFSCGIDYAPKVRKPYTITKQRERWTEEEHKKFLEALKMYGRAWRRIEEHVGTKTAVQIRSHAQKFFSKVVRESSGTNTSSMEPIEIPPPRPKRKPMHPYPRKMAHPPLKKPTIKTASLHNSVLEQENHSPTSVLSAVGSEFMGSLDCNTPTGSQSPVSSSGAQAAGLETSGTNQSAEENACSIPGSVTATTSLNEETLEKFELLPRESASNKEVSTQSLKLFGRTVLVTDSRQPSSPILGTSKPLSLEEAQKKPIEKVAWNSMDRDSTDVLSPVLPPELLISCTAKTELRIPLNLGSAAPAPNRTLYGSITSTALLFRVPNPTEAQEKETQKEGSWTGSNTGLVNHEENGERSSETQHSSDSEEKKSETVLRFKQSEKSAFSDVKAGRGKPFMGFVPYKRCLAERDTASSRCEERGEQIIHLSL